MRAVNLLPESQRRRTPSGDGRSAYAVVGALALMLLMTGLYVLTANQATSRADAAAAASAEADRLEARATQLGAFGDFAQVKQARVAAVRQLAGSRFDWERLMRELARVLPPSGWLTAVAASTTGELGDSSAAPAAAGTPTGGPSATLTGCLPRQPDVADLMLRLRRMHRVEDVMLRESVLEDERGAPTVDNCGRYYRFDVTVAFAPAAPEEAPDGHRRVPATLGGGS